MDGAFDILIIGAGPAGISAALTARARGRSVCLISNAPETSALWRAHRIDNYPGLAGMSGAELLGAMSVGLNERDIRSVTGRVTGVMALGGQFMASVGQDVYTARSIILATGAAQTAAYPGETELLGRGVSYCATCDGMLYRGKRVAVIGLSAEAEGEADFLRSIGCEVEYFDRSRAKRYEITGVETVAALVADGVEYPVEAVFVLRDAIAAAVLVPGLSLSENHIAADRAMRTSIPGVFACGDCTGRPYQIAKAVGDGNIAALSADTFLKENPS